MLLSEAGEMTVVSFWLFKDLRLFLFRGREREFIAKADLCREFVLQ